MYLETTVPLETSEPGMLVTSQWRLGKEGRRSGGEERKKRRGERGEGGVGGKDEREALPGAVLGKGGEGSVGVDERECVKVGRGGGEGDMGLVGEV